MQRLCAVRAAVDVVLCVHQVEGPDGEEGGRACGGDRKAEV